MNPLMQGMNMAKINPQFLQQVKQMMNMVKMAGNPQAALNQAAQSNPALGSVMQMCQGKSPKSVFYAQCKQMGINPDDVINQLK